MTQTMLGFRPTVDDAQRIQHIGEKLKRRCRGPLPKITEVIRAALAAASELAANDQLLTVLDEGERRRVELSKPHG